MRCITCGAQAEFENLGVLLAYAIVGTCALSQRRCGISQVKSSMHEGHARIPTPSQQTW